ncbi:MAG TPA: carbonic anhydrase [Brumimicrobium sp.]|nr:carbonic anhydrase [Brumimicrobium sp.]
MDKFYQSMLDGNKKWAEDQVVKDPNYFNKLLKGQKPPVLWIGCADSRVPANQVINADPGDVFVHRNIANMVIHSDMNMLSVLDYAVNILKVKHVIVCGHYDCGGIVAAMSNKQYGLIDNWIRHIKDVYRFHKEEMDSIKDAQKRLDRMVELNVYEQVQDLAKTSIIQQAWACGQEIHLHGWVYSLEDGLVRDQNCTIKNSIEIEGVYQVEE